MTFTIEKKSINDVFIKPNQRFEIPRFQRQYSWEENNIQEFWDTITGDEEVFLGTLIFDVSRKADDKIIEIIDGQQRYLTIQILAAALRDFCLDKAANDPKLTEVAEGVVLTLLANVNAFNRTELTPNLIPGDSIRDFFHKYIQDPEPGVRLNKDVATGKNVERGRVKRAYLTFMSMLDEHTSHMDLIQIKAFIVDLVTNKIGPHFFARIEIDSQEIAYEIFETVNAKRVDLNVADLIKNQIFKHVIGSDGTYEDPAKQKWATITETLEEIEISMTKFLSYYWSSKYGYISERKLYREISKKFGNKADKWSSFLDELELNAELMSLILRGSRDAIANQIGNRQEATKIWESLRILRGTKVQTWAILYLCLLRHLSVLDDRPSRIPVSFRKKWEIFADFTFVYYQILNLGANWYFKEMWTFCTKIEDLVEVNANGKKFDNLVNNLFKDFASQLPTSSDEFIAGFLKLRYKDDIKTKVILRYVLSEIETALSGKYYIGFDESLVNIEHVLPQEPAAWGFKKKEVKDYVNRIGNLLLISISQNGSVGNKPLSEKLTSFGEHSTMLQVKEFVKHVQSTEWDFSLINPTNSDFSAIEKRGRALAELGYDIWVIKLRAKMGF